MKKIVILFSGEGSNMINIIKTLHPNRINVVAAITNNPNAKGIEKVKKSGIKTIVLDHKLFDSREKFDEKLVEIIDKLNVDLSVLAGFMRILTPVFTSKIRAINIHPSLLPAFKGANALKRGFEAPLKKVGVTTHFVTDDLDSGEIIMQKSFDKTGMSFEDYEKKIHECEYEIYPPSILKALNQNEFQI